MKNRKVNRPTSTRYGWTMAQKQEMRQLYEAQDYSIEDVAIHFDTSRETIRYHLKRQGVTLRPVGCMTEKAKNKQRGANHHSWSGGRYRHRSGYCYAIAHGHPHAKNGYVYEHRLVMEAHLLASDPNHPALQNGVLSRKWIVHHVNGDKSDNRLQNLEVLPRNVHHSWMHYHDEMARLKSILTENGIAF
jgi:hypothetical protein